jgi:fatty acid desaturase
MTALVPEQADPASLVAPVSYRIPWRLNLVIAGAQLAALGCVLWTTGRAGHWWQIALLSAAMAVVGNAIYSLIHEAEHRLLLPHPLWNDLLGAFLALFFPAPYHLIRQGHLGHHRRNRSDDEAFDLYFDGDKPWLKRLILYGILTGGYWLLVTFSNLAVVLCPFLFKRQLFDFDRPSAAFMESLNPRYWRLIWLEGLLAILLHAGIIVCLDVPPLRYLAVYFGFGFAWSAMQYVHHFGTERHVLVGARNLWLFAPLDWIWLQHNWHRTHHRHPTVPWVYLPTIGRNEDPQREFLIRHYLRMWRGPRRTEEHVENHFAGRVIQ